MSKPDIEAIRKKHFPMALGNGYEARQSTRETVRAFVDENYAKVFSPERNAQRPQRTPEAKARIEGMVDLYHKLHHDYLFIYSPEGEIVGWHFGEAEDWATFYMRNTGILPEHQGKGVYTQLLQKMEIYLEEIGYERISSQHQGTNRAILITKLRAGYSIAGLELTDLWGPLVKVVKNLAEYRRVRFYELYGDKKHMDLEKKPQE